MSCCGGGADPGEAARQQEAQRQASVLEGTESINKVYQQFTPDFYNKRAQDYIGWARPQLAEQQQAAGKQATFQLARQGLLNSGAAETTARDLQLAGNRGIQQIVDTGQQQANQLRRDVEGERSNLINQLHATGDPALAAQRAIATASNLQLPSPLAPVGNMFSDLTNQYLQRQQASIWNATAQGSGMGGGNTGTPRAPLPTPSRIVR